MSELSLNPSLNTSHTQLQSPQPPKKNVLERLSLLIDIDSFEEIDHYAKSPYVQNLPSGDGVLCGFGTIEGRRIAFYIQDFSVKGGSLGKRQSEKICKVMDIASKIGCPIIGIVDSGGARIDEGIHALAGYGEIFMRNVRYSGIVPQISLILGPCAGGAVYSPALTDFILTTRKISQLFITGPQVIEEVLHQTISKEELGGADIHASRSGVVHFVSETEEDCFQTLKQLLTYLPNNYKSYPAAYENSYTSTPNFLANIVPDNTNKSFDVRLLIAAIVDSYSFFEVQEQFALNIVVGFARLNGEAVGFIANQTTHKAGTLDINASCKAARFIKTCNNFNIPIISLVDVPGFLPGIEQEHNGIIRHGAKLIYAYAQATVPKITVILRKAFGGAYIVMGSKHLGADLVYAWPTAQIAVMGAQGAIAILHRKKLQNSSESDAALLQKKLINEYEEHYLTPRIAAESGYIDAIIEPQKTREHLLRALQITNQKVELMPERKHGNIPL